MLQAMDAGGKDGVHPLVLTGLNPAGVQVTSFGVPTRGRASPTTTCGACTSTARRAGTIGVFNRSHYEDVLVVRVKRLVPEDPLAAALRPHPQASSSCWSTRARRSSSCTSTSPRRSSAERLQDRVDSPDERWKFRVGDLDDRALWDDYMAAFERPSGQTSARHRPVVRRARPTASGSATSPSRRILRHTLEQLDPQYPPPEPGVDGIVVV